MSAIELTGRSSREPAQHSHTSAAPPIDGPLSLNQQSFFFTHEFFPQPSACNVAVATRLSGALDDAALERAFATLVQHHEQLRTTFHQHDGALLARLHAVGVVEFQRHDLRELSADERGPALERLLDEEATRRFDLARLPLIRASLVRLAQDEHVLLLVNHHITSDGVSLIQMFHAQLATLYDAFRQGEVVSLPEATAHYSDFVRWQAERNQGKNFDRRLKYWRAQLADAPASIDLPTDRTRPPVPSGRGARLDIAVIPGLREQIKQVAASLEAAENHVLLAAFYAQLYRYSAQTDLVVGVPFANRTHPGLDDVFGCMINTLPMRARVEPEKPFAELVEQARTATFRGTMQGDLAFEKMVEHLGVAGDKSRSQVHQALFNFMPFSPSHARWSGLESHARRVDCRAAFLDLILEVIEEPEGYAFALVYSTDLYAEASMRRFAGHYAQLLQSVVGDPHVPISRLQMLTPAELQQIDSWNRTEREIHDSRFVHERFEHWAKHTPDAPAIELARGPQSYRDLDASANRLARFLRSHGVESDCFVGLYLERGPEVLLPILAIFKAGGAYVPADADSPAQRASAVFAEVGAKVVITTSDLAPGLELPSGTALFLLDADLAQLDQHDSSPLNVPVAGEHAAYAIFTSGSTGKPKGVVVEHRQIRNYLTTLLDHFQAEPGASFAMVSTFAADLGLAMLFGAPCTGGHLHILPQAVAVDPGAMAAYYEKHGIDYVKLVPTHMEALLQSEQGVRLLPRRMLMLAGDRLTPELVKKLRAVRPKCSIHNHYGPTETCISMLTHEVTELERYADRPTVPIGKPIGNVQCHIVDAFMQPVPIGVAGELYIGGSSVSRGYLGRPDLTQERFIPDPFSREPGARMYRTGDRVRYWADGNIEFITRIDGQLKIRGYRVEIGEVETALRSLPAVKQAVVLAREERPGERTLVAYAVPGAAEAASADALRQALAALLPKYMIPSHFVLLDALPTTPNGKLDRNALPAPGQSRSDEIRFDPPEGLDKQPTSSWLYRAVWAPSPAPPADPSPGPHTWLLFVDELGVGDALARRLQQRGDRVVCVRSRDAFHRAGEHEFHLNPEHAREGYEQLVRELADANVLPDRVVHCWLLTANEQDHRPGSNAFHRNQEHGLRSALYLVQALSRRTSSAAHFALISNGMHSLRGTPAEHPDKATALGALAGLSRELPHWTCSCVDVSLPQLGVSYLADVRWRLRGADRVARTIAGELALPPANGVFALRAGSRYERRYEACAAHSGGPPRSALASSGTVLVTGGDTPVGRAAVRFFSAQPHAKVAMLEADLGDPAAVASELRDLADRLGPIGAVVHAADVSVGSIGLAQLDPVELEEAMVAPVQGLRVLEQALDFSSLEIVLLCSHLSHAVRAPGQAAAAAVAAFFDAHAGRHASSKVRSVGFGAFRGAAEPATGASPVEREVNALLQERAIEPGEETSLFAALLSAGPDPLVVDTIRLDRHDALLERAAQVAAKLELRPRRPPQDEVERKLLRYWQETLQTTDIGIDDDFFALGGHSLAAVRLFARIQRGFGVQFPLAELFKAPTIASSAERIRQAIDGASFESPPQRYVVPIHPGPADASTVPLFVVHGAKGNVLNLRHLGALIGRDRPFYGLQARGLLGEDAPHETFEAAARDYLAEVRQVQPHGPYLLGGFCIGGNLAYEMTRQLEAAGERVALLVMLDAYAPDGDYDPPTRIDNLQMHAQRLKSEGVGYVKVWARRRVRWELERLRGRFAQPEFETAEYRSDMIHMAMRAARERYAMWLYDGRVVLFRPRVDCEQHFGRFARLDWERNFWGDRLPQLVVHEVPGDHDSCVLEPAVRTLAARLRPLLRIADER